MDTHFFDFINLVNVDISSDDRSLLTKPVQNTSQSVILARIANTKRAKLALHFENNSFLISDKIGRSKSNCVEIQNKASLALHTFRKVLVVQFFQNDSKKNIGKNRKNFLINLYQSVSTKVSIRCSRLNT